MRRRIAEPESRQTGDDRCHQLSSVEAIGAESLLPPLVTGLDAVQPEAALDPRFSPSGLLSTDGCAWMAMGLGSLVHPRRRFCAKEEND
jgi:hypothetical protein